MKYTFSKMIQLVSASLVLLIAVSLSSHGADLPAVAKSPEQLVKTAIDKGLAVLNDPELKSEKSRSIRRERIRKIILDAADMPMIARLSLSHHQKKFTAEELATFTDIFSQLLFNTYIGHIEKYSGDPVSYKKTQKISDTKVTIPVRVSTSDGVIPIDFSLFAKGDIWRIYDVKIEGVSLVNNYRQQFNKILLNKTPGALIQQLKDKVAENEDI